jgi:hypothetical protein
LLQCSFGRTKPFTAIWIQGIPKDLPIVQDVLQRKQPLYCYNDVFQAALMTFCTVSDAEDYYKRLKKVPGVQVRVNWKMFPANFASCLFLGGFCYQKVFTIFSRTGETAGSSCPEVWLHPDQTQLYVYSLLVNVSSLHLLILPGLDLVPQSMQTRTLRLCHLPTATADDVRELMEPHGFIVVSF